MTVVVAAGNGHEGTPQNACGFAPAHVGKLITVAAAGLNDTKEPYSNHGDCIDLFAPVFQNGGTSTATAYVSGAAAQQLQMFSYLSPSDVRDRLIARATTNVLSNIGPGSPNRLLYTRTLPLSIELHGADIMGPNTGCQWSGMPIGGQPPYSLQWLRDGAAVGNLWDYTVTAAGPISFGLSLSVTDGVGRVAFTGRFVTIDPFNTDYWCGGF